MSARVDFGGPDILFIQIGAKLTEIIAKNNKKLGDFAKVL